MRAARGVLLLVLALGTTGQAAAQGLQPGERRPELPAPAPAAGEDPRRLRLPPLSEPPAAELPLDAARVEGFRIEGSSVFGAEELAAAVEPWTGRTLAFEELLAARDAVTRLYVESGYVTSGAVLPDQDLQDGIVRLVVVEGALAEVEVRGARRFRPDYFRWRLLRAAAAPLQVSRIEETLQRLQRDPWIERVDARLEPGERLGESRLVLAVSEALPWAARVEASNERSPAVGSGGGVVRGQTANLLGLRDVWTGRFEASEGLIEGEARLRLPITPWDTQLQLRFRETRTRIVERPFEALDIESSSRTWGISLFHPLYRAESDELWLELTGEHRRTRSEVLGSSFCFELETASCSAPTVAVLRMGGQWTRRTQSDVVALRSLVSVGLDILGASVGGGARAPDGQFVAWLGQVQWAHVLPESVLGSHLLLRADLQIADDPLLSIEKFAVGGRQTVRGYRENQLVRDNGVVISGELRIPVWRDALRRHLIEVAPFADFGHAWNVGPQPPEDTLLGLGLGLRAMPREGIVAELYWGGRLIDVGGSLEDPQDLGFSMRISVDVPDVF